MSSRIEAPGAVRLRRHSRRLRPWDPSSGKETRNASHTNRTNGSEPANCRSPITLTTAVMMSSVSSTARRNGTGAGREPFREALTGCAAWRTDSVPLAIARPPMRVLPICCRATRDPKRGRLDESQSGKFGSRFGRRRVPLAQRPPVARPDAGPYNKKGGLSIKKARPNCES